MKLSPRLSLAPVPYYWPRDSVLAFYNEVLETAVDIVYLGETVCSKRRALRTAEWLELAQRIEDAGKEVVISTLCLLEAESELKTLRRLCENKRFMVEANDIAAVHLLAGKEPFVTGPMINIYNDHTLQFLAGLGLRRWTMPVELARDTLAAIQRNRPQGVETEVMVYGRLPLAISARCFTARNHNLPKDDCQYRCLNDPDGILLTTRENEPFLAINGVQLLSAQTYNLLPEIEELVALDVDILRITPQSENTARVIQVFHECLTGKRVAVQGQSELDQLMPVGPCNGYWQGQAGILRLSAVDCEG